MKNLNLLLANNNATIYGFPAFVGLKSNKSSENNIVVSTLSPALMAEKGIYEYYAPVVPRGLIFRETAEILEADLNANVVRVVAETDIYPQDEVTICSRHKETIDILKNMFPNHVLLENDITPDDIKGKDVVGTLPPHLIQYANRFKAITIAQFDNSKEDDLKGKELADRVQINKTISVKIC